MGGFEVLAQVAAYNGQAWDDWYDEALEYRREGIPVSLWRALPDSPGAA
jgi:hypothetical protein